MTNELEALIRQIVSEIEGAKGNTTHYSTPHTSSTLNRTAVVDRVLQSKIIRLLKNILNGLI